MFPHMEQDNPKDTAPTVAARNCATRESGVPAREARRAHRLDQLAYERNLSARSPWRSLTMTSRSIWRTRSRDRPNSFPI